MMARFIPLILAAAAFVSAGSALAQCPTPAETDLLLAKIQSGDGIFFDERSRIRPYLMDCAELSPSGATLLRIDTVHTGVTPDDVRARLLSKGYEREAVELDWPLLYGDRPPALADVVARARRVLQLKEQPATALDGPAWRVLGRLAVFDQSLCETAVHLVQTPAADLRTEGARSALADLLICGRKWGVTSVEAVALPRIEASLDQVSVRSSRASEVAALFAVAAELRSEAVLATAMRLHRELYFGAGDPNAGEAALAAVTAQLALGHSAEAQATARAACRNSAPIDEACHLVRLLPDLWRGALPAIVAVHTAYGPREWPATHPPSQVWRRSPLLAVVRAEYVRRALAAKRLAGITEVLDARFYSLRGEVPVSIARMHLACMLLRAEDSAEGGYNADLSSRLSDFSSGFRVYGAALTPSDRQWLLACASDLLPLALRKEIRSGAMIEAVSPALESMPAADSLALRVQLARTLLLHSEKLYNVKIDAKALLNPILDITGSDQHFEAAKLAIRVGLDRGDRAFEERARASLSGAERDLLPPSLRDDRPFRTAFELESALEGWRKEVYGGWSPRDVNREASYFERVTADGALTEQALIERSATIATRVSAARKVLTKFDSADSYRREPLLCDGYLLDDYAGWNSLLDSATNAAVNRLMPNAPLVTVRGTLSVEALRPRARTVGRAIEDLTVQVVRRAQATDASGALKALQLHDQILESTLSRRAPSMCDAASKLRHAATTLQDFRLGFLVEAGDLHLSDAERLQQIDAWLDETRRDSSENLRAIDAEGRKLRAAAYNMERATDILKADLDVEGVHEARGAAYAAREAYTNHYGSMTASQEAPRTRLADLRKKLNGDEAILVIGKGTARMVEPDDTSRLANTMVTTLITADHTFSNRSDSFAYTARLLTSIDTFGRTPTTLPDFDLAEAHKFYQGALAPVLAKAPAVRTLYVIATFPDWADGLPLGTLVTRMPPQGTAPSDIYAKARWLIDDFNVVYLSSLSDIPGRDRVSPAKRTFAFAGPTYGRTRALDAEAMDEFRSQAISLSGARRVSWKPDTCGLPPISDISFAGDGDTLAMRAEDASEAKFKAMAGNGELASFGVLVFYSHGDQVGGDRFRADPALALAPTPSCAKRVAGLPPAAAEQQQDGFLTGYEIAQFDLGPGWVILAACQTAAEPDLPEAFFAAGRSMVLGSSVSVFDTSTTQLVASLAADADGSRTAAAMLAIRAIKSRPDWSHPAFWGAWRVIAR